MFIGRRSEGSVDADAGALALLGGLALTSTGSVEVADGIACVV